MHSSFAPLLQNKREHNERDPRGETRQDQLPGKRPLSDELAENEGGGDKIR
jgi:hypothetical protein